MIRFLFNLTARYILILCIHHVRPEVDGQHGDRSQGQRDAEEDERDEREQLGDVGRERVHDGLLQVVEDDSALLDADDYRREVVVHEYHVRCFLRHVRPGYAHGYSCPQCGA